MSAQELIWTSAATQRETPRSSRSSAVELTRAHLDRLDAVEPALFCQLHRMDEIALTSGRSSRPANRVGERRADDRHHRVTQGRALHHRRPDDGGIPDPRGLPIAVRCDGGRATAGAGRRIPGQVQYRRVRDGLIDRKLGVRHDPQSLGYQPGAGRKFGRPGRGGRRGGGSISLGSDTGGSIRQPAGFCGVVGLKPTYGRVSRYGLIAFASSLDQIGPFTRTVEDAAMALTAIAGHDRRDSTSSPRPCPNYRSGWPAICGERDRRGARVLGGRDGAGGRARRSRRSRTASRRWAPRSIEVTLPHTSYALATYYITAPAEASANLARFDGVRYGFPQQAGSLKEMYERTRGEGFGDEVKRRIMLGTYALSSGYYDAYYVKAQKVRTLIKRDFDDAFARLTQSLRPPHQLSPSRSDHGPTTRSRCISRTSSPSPRTWQVSPASPFPAASATDCRSACRCSDARSMSKAILRIAHAYEQATEWHTARPAI